MSNKKKHCEFCTYNWISRVSTPKACPRCKRRFDYKDARKVLRHLGRQYNLNLMRHL